MKMATDANIYGIKSPNHSLQKCHMYTMLLSCYVTGYRPPRFQLKHPEITDVLYESETEDLADDTCVMRTSNTISGTIFFGEKCLCDRRYTKTKI